MSPARRSGFKWLILSAFLVLLPVLAVFWVISPGGISTADLAAARALRVRIAQLDETAAPGSGLRSELERQADAIFVELMTDAGGYRLAETHEARASVLEVNALRAMKLADLQRENPGLRLQARETFNERETDYLQRVVAEMIRQSSQGDEPPLVIESRDLIDAGAVLQENGALGSLSIQTTPQGFEGNLEPVVDPTMAPIVISSGGIANELEQLEPAARFLAVLNRPLWWNPVNEKLAEMLSPSQDVPAAARENWSNDLDSYSFPIELISSPEPFAWREIVPRYLDRRLDTALNTLEQTANWSTMRDWLASRGSRNLPGQLVDGFFLKLRRKSDFRRVLGWIEAVIQAAPGIESFGDLTAIDHPALGSELPMLADIASDSIHRRLLAAAYLLRTGQIPAHLDDNPYFQDPYTGKPIVLEKSWSAGNAESRRILLVSVGPDARPDTYRQPVKDDVVVDIELEPGSAAWKLIAE